MEFRLKKEFETNSRSLNIIQSAICNKKLKIKLKFNKDKNLNSIIKIYLLLLSINV